MRRLRSRFGTSFRGLGRRNDQMKAADKSETRNKSLSSSPGKIVAIETASLLAAITPVWLWMLAMDHETPVDRGRYLAQIGACQACHTPPAVSEQASGSGIEQAEERTYRSDPDWFAYLDKDRQMAGGVPFIIRIASDSHGVVYSRNISPDPVTGIGSWTDDEIVRAIRSGERPDGTNLFLFAPHSFFKNLTHDDAAALAAYLRTLPPVRNEVLRRQLPFEPPSATDVSGRQEAPQGRTRERAEYLLDAIVGCAECHSHHDETGRLVEFAGGDPIDPYIGVFRLGPDLPLRQSDRGFAAFPYPGYGVIYGGNLTRFGLGGDLHVDADLLVRAMRTGVATQPDAYGRPRPLGHAMLWQFYAKMTDDDAYAIAEYVQSLEHIPHSVGTGPILFGEDWAAAFEQVYGEPPSALDRQAFGK